MDLLLYLIKVNIVFSVLFLVYRWSLRNETFFLANRAWLLGSALVALLLPLVSFSGMSHWMPVVELPEFVVGLATEGSSAEGRILPGVLPIVHAWGALLFLGLLLRDLWITRRGMRNGSVDEAVSFFRHIVLPKQVAPADRELMRSHEEVHVRHGHSHDVIFFRVMQALSWFNPLWWLALRELRLLHEFTADAETASKHAGYDRVLLAHAMGVSRLPLGNAFRSTNIKKRSIMLYRSRSPLRAGIKYALSLPVLAVAVLLLSGGPAELVAQDPATPSEKAFTKVDKMPEFPGGEGALFAYLGNNLQYPKAAADAGIAGVVYVSFVVEKDGRIGDVKVLRGIGGGCDEEAMRVVQEMPRWEPGEQDGELVRVQYNLPMRFEMSKKP